MVIKEVCLENNVGLSSAIKKGADRIELCDNLAEGGTSPSYGVAKRVTATCHEHNIKVMAMVRPRKGNFIYDDLEASMMLDDIKAFKEIGVDGVVFGCVTKDGKIDKPKTKQMVDAAKGLDITFHMAFDDLVEEEKTPSIDWLSEIGVARILTHGGDLRDPIECNLDEIKGYVEYAKGKLIIIPGGGVTDKTLEMVVNRTGAKEVHGTQVLGTL